MSCSRYTKLCFFSRINNNYEKNVRSELMDSGQCQNSARYPGKPKSQTKFFQVNIFVFFCVFFYCWNFLCGYLIFNGQQVLMKTDEKNNANTSGHRTPHNSQLECALWRGDPVTLHKYNLLVSCVFLRWSCRFFSNISMEMECVVCVISLLFVWKPRNWTGIGG